jgi:hypothetical protein
MKTKTLVAVVLGGVLAAAAARAEGPVRRVAEPIRDEYVVVLKDGAAALDAAVRTSIAGGVSYVLAAGNGNLVGIPKDACTTSPARVTEAITVSATNRTDKKPFWAAVEPGRHAGPGEGRALRQDDQGDRRRGADRQQPPALHRLLTAGADLTAASRWSSWCTL